MYIYAYISKLPDNPTVNFPSLSIAEFAFSITRSQSLDDTSASDSNTNIVGAAILIYNLKRRFTFISNLCIELGTKSKSFFHLSKSSDLKRNEEDGILRSKHLITVETIKSLPVKHKIWLMF